MAAFWFLRSPLLNRDAASDSMFSSPKDRVIEKLLSAGVPAEVLEEFQPGFVAFVKGNNKARIKELVESILPTVLEAKQIVAAIPYRDLGIFYRESLNWLKWLMFEDDPECALKELSDISTDQRGVCGAVWGGNDIAYRCRTCEHDPTCAICVCCFQNGNHKDHDYSIMYTGGGCCDCGDETAWNREGFCSKHRGSDHIQQLPEKYASCVCSVLDPLLIYWRDALLRAMDRDAEGRIVHLRMADEVTHAIVEVLLEFCRRSESLLSFVSKRLSCSSLGLLEVFMHAERIIVYGHVEILHDLVLMLLSEPSFKYEFATVFLYHYSDVMKEAIQKINDRDTDDYPMIATLSVQIFTVPKLTLQLVKEMNLLEKLLGCLKDIFTICAGDNGRLLVSKWGFLYETTVRVLGDIKFALRHKEVPQYVFNERPGILKTWIQLLVFVQGMDPQRREAHVHVEEEIKNVMLPFLLGRLFLNTHSLFVNGAFSVPQEENVAASREQDLGDEYGVRHAKVGRASQENPVNYISPSISSRYFLKDNEEKCKTTPPSSIVWILHECLRAIDNWLRSEMVMLDDDFICEVRGSMVEKSAIVVPDGECIHEIRGSMVEGGYVVDLHAFKLLSLCEWPTMTFDVSLQNVSMHIPLHRLVSLLLIEALERCYAEVPIANSLSSSLHFDFFDHVLRGCHPYGFSAHIMEHPLHNRVFSAQIRAGMWRRNGDAVKNLYAWYRKYQGGGQDLELDLFLLQSCAAVAPADHYVSRIVDRFGLSGFFFPSLDHLTEYEPIMVLEMLTLLIQIIQERRFCGKTTAESLRRELICRLAVGNATRSQLLKFLSSQLSKSDQFQKVLENVASYSNPSGLSQGVYKLRQHCWKELDLYYFRWSSKELQIVEERYLQICRTSALIAQVPKWTSIYPPLNGISVIATCPTMFHIIRAVIYYAVMNDDTSTRRSPNVVLFASLHLLYLVLDCYEQRNFGALSSANDTFTLRVCYSEVFGDYADDGFGFPSLVSLLIILMRERKNNVLHNFGEDANNVIYSLTEGLLKRFVEIDSGCMERLKILAPEVVYVKPSTAIEEGSKKWKTKARERQAVMLEKMKAEQSKFMATMRSNSDEFSVGQEIWKDDIGLVSQESTCDVCSLCRDPGSSSLMCHLVLLQKSRLLSFTDRSPQTWDKAQQSDLSFLPARSSTDQLAVNSLSTTPISISSLEAGQSLVNECNFEEVEEDLYFAIQRDKNNAANALVNEQCLQELEGSNTNLVRKYLDALSKEVDRRSSSRSRSITKHNGGAPILVPAYDGFGPADSDGIHLSSCGHVVHNRCLNLYLSSLRKRSRRQILSVGGHMADLHEGEFFCPVCRCLANASLPALHGGSSRISPQSLRDNVILSHSTGGGSNFFYFHQGLSLLKTAAIKVGTEIFLGSFPSQISERITPDIEPIIHILQKFYFVGKYDLFSEPIRINPSLILWDVLKYSLMSFEIACRSASTTISPVYDLSVLYAGLKSSSGFILSLLLSVVRCTCFKKAIHVIQRYRGIVLFARAICLDANTEIKVDEIESSLRQDQLDLQYPDIQFWRRAAAPVISYNPFCSLMWVLFCLPHQFSLSEDSFYSIVHLFYAVTVVQAVISCCIKYGQKIKDLELHGSLISDIDNVMVENKIIQQYFVSVCIDTSCNLHDNIRRLSFPYLRRCALLWKLFNISAPKSVQSSAVYGESSSSPVGMLDDENYLTGELGEVEKLEKMFKLPAIDTILKDEILRSQSLKWIQHFMMENEGHDPKYRFFCRPATPFQLVQLPHIYQELLGRYIKQCCQVCSPALCLLCGKLCYDNPKSCCSKNGSQVHVKSCGREFGLFLLIKKTTIFIVKTLYRTKWPSLYLDAFGEEDYEMQRGKPLYLNEERYAVLTHLVVSHQLDRSSNVLR